MVNISFILPVYKTEKYLPRVIKSLKEQTMASFEAIFTDDGSPDSSAAIIADSTQGDERFKLIRKENGGVSSARNAALDAASGKYILFLDSDDFIEPETAEILFNTAEREKADIVFFGRSNDYYKNGVMTRSDDAMPRAEGTFRGNPCAELFDKIATSYFVTDKLFKRDIIEENKIRFRNMNIGEDGVFFAEYIRQDINCAVFIKKALYHYTIDEGATLSVSYHEERVNENFVLSEAMEETVEKWGLLKSPMHSSAVKYCTVRDLQLGIKNINLSGKSFSDRCLWLLNVLKDDRVRRAVRDTPLKAAESRNDKIKLLLLKIHLYRTVIYVSSLNQRGGK